MKNDTSDVKIPVGLLLTVCHPPSLKMATTGFLEAPKPTGSLSHPQLKVAIEPTNPSRMTLAHIQYVQYVLPYCAASIASNNFEKNVTKTGKRISETPPPTLMP